MYRFYPRSVSTVETALLQNSAGFQLCASPATCSLMILVSPHTKTQNKSWLVTLKLRDWGLAWMGSCKVSVINVPFNIFGERASQLLFLQMIIFTQWNLINSPCTQHLFSILKGIFININALWYIGLLLETVYDVTYQQVILICMHVFIHELEYCEPESRECRQR